MAPQACFALRPAHARGIDVVAQPREHRSAQVIVVGPAVEAHLGDGLRLDPRRRRIELGLFGERAGVASQRGQAGFHLRERAIVEADPTCDA
jgi:hypothetical protein